MKTKPSTDKNAWAVTPKYLLRKDCVEHQIDNWLPAEFIEFGAGTGNFTRVFLDRGFNGVCYDLSAENRRTIETNLSSYENVKVVDHLDEIVERKFKYVFAVEVMEHINDDEQALRQWSSFLATGGKLVLTVPAHQRKFGTDDIQVGHVRRYEKASLHALLENCGFQNIEILNYGFPLGNLTRIVRNLMLRMETSRVETAEQSDAVELSKRSGRSRSTSILRLSFLFRKSILWPFLLLQRLTWQFDWGDGYVATAEKVEHGSN